MKLGTLDVRCNKCGARCFAKHSDPSFTRYYCERRSCDGSRKVPRTIQRLEGLASNGK